ELMLEILNSSDIRDKKRLKELLGEIYTGKKMGLVGSGHNTALERAFSAFSKAARFDQLTDGIAYYEKVKSLYENFDDCADDIIARLEYILRTVVRKDNLFVSLTCRQAEYDVFAEHFPMFKEAIKEENLPEPPALESDFAPGSKEAYKISGQIQYNALAGNFKKAGVTLTGAAEVMKTILSYEYLWMNVRVKGGAYGCFFRYGAGTGNCGFVSYRDPKLKETYDVYKGAADFIRNLELTQEQVDKYIIGTLSTIDAPRLPGAMGTYSLQMLLSGADDKYLHKQRDEILGATNETIRETAGLLDAASLSFCTVGSAGKCEENKEMFDSIKELE
ncbi:MAG: insulinase family protein, partial [Clostridia bacterium]|nr:insulinase family protein [Clostridia bacterium]